MSALTPDTIEDQDTGIVWVPILGGWQAEFQDGRSPEGVYLHPIEGTATLQVHHGTAGMTDEDPVVGSVEVGTLSESDLLAGIPLVRVINDGRYDHLPADLSGRILFAPRPIWGEEVEISGYSFAVIAPEDPAWIENNRRLDPRRISWVSEAEAIEEARERVEREYPEADADDRVLLSQWRIWAAEGMI